MQTFLEFLAQNALGAALLAVVVVALMPIVRRPAARNALWLIVFARLLLPPLWSVPVFPTADTSQPPQSMAHIEPIAPHSPVREIVASGSDLPAPLAFETSELLPVPPAVMPTVEPLADPIAVSASIRSEHDNPTSPSAGAAVSDSPSLPQWLVPPLFGIWLVGFLVVAALALTRIRRFERGLRDAIRAPTDVQELADSLARRLGLRHSPTVLLAPGRVPPMLWLSSLFARQARLILPMELCFRLDAEQRSALMAHELAHLRRGDPWVRWLELLAVALYWWFPLVGFFRKRLRESEEQCCDGWVVSLLSQRKAYATALVETVEYLDRPDQPAAPALASGASPVHDLQRRLTMIMCGRVRGRLSKFGVLTVLGIAVGALAFGPAFSQQDPPREKRDRGEGKKDKERPMRGEGKGEGEKERPMRGEGGFEGKEKGRFQPKGEGKFQPKGDEFNPRERNEEIEKARNELQKAREEAERAVQRVREMEERFQRLMGRGPMGPGPGPMGPGPGPGGPPMGELGRGGDRQMQELQRQVEEMRRMLEELRREISRGPADKSGPNPMGKGNFRPGGFPGGPGGFPGRPGGMGGSGGGPGGGPGGRGGPEKLPQPPEKDN